MLGRDVSLMSSGAYVVSDGGSDVASPTHSLRAWVCLRIPYRCWDALCSALNRRLVSGSSLRLWSRRRASRW